MTVNDIAPGELAVLPEGYRTACFDVAGDLTDVAHLRGSFDLAFSRMVFEHVADGEQAWANLHELLAPGGVALAFVPTLYALPFVLNWLLPDKIAAAIVKLVYRHRTDDGDPVFPARYSWCFAGGDRLRNMLSALGYREVIVQPFYGHGYYAPSLSFATSMNGSRAWPNAGIGAFSQALPISPRANDRDWRQLAAGTAPSIKIALRTPCHCRRVNRSWPENPPSCTPISALCRRT